MSKNLLVSYLHYYLTSTLAALNKSETIIVIFFSDDVLDKMAEILEVKVRLLDKGQAVPFKNYAEEMFEQF